MPIHDWTRVDAGIFHHFHQAWIVGLASRLNRGLLPPSYYALAEQQTGIFGPDVLALQGGRPANRRDQEDGGTLLAPPKPRVQVETPSNFYRRKQSRLVVRHVSGDDVIAVVEIVSRGNKSSRVALQQFIEKATELLARGIHLLVVDLHPPGPRDPGGIHGAIWEDWAGDDPGYEPSASEPLMGVSYEADLSVRAYIEPMAVGRPLPEMPLFLEPGGCVLVPLEATYQSVWDDLPQRWREVLEFSS